MSLEPNDANVAISWESFRDVNPCQVTAQTRVLVYRALGALFPGVKFGDVRVLWVDKKDSMIWTACGLQGELSKDVIEDASIDLRFGQKLYEVLSKEIVESIKRWLDKHGGTFPVVTQG